MYVFMIGQPFWVQEEQLPNVLKLYAEIFCWFILFFVSSFDVAKIIAHAFAARLKITNWDKRIIADILMCFLCLERL